MKYCFYILVLLFACSDNDELLMDHYKIQYAGDFQLGTCGHIEAVMISQEQAAIYAGDYNMFTEDNFKTYRGLPREQVQMFCSYELAYYDMENILLYNLDNDHHFAYEINLMRSADFGKTFSSDLTITEHDLVDPFFPGADRYLSKPFFFDAHHGIIASHHADQWSRKLDLFSIEGDLIKYRSSIIGNYYPVKYKFSGAKGFMLMSNFNTESDPVGTKFYFSTTSNQGVSWTTPVPIAGAQKLLDFTYSGNTILVYNDHAVYRSSDGGASWQVVSAVFEGKIADIQAADQNTFYAAAIYDEDDFGDISHIYRSAGGSTWEKLEEDAYASKLSFYDQNNGLAMNRDILQVTHDGGKTWKPAIFPPAP